MAAKFELAEAFVELNVRGQQKFQTSMRSVEDRLRRTQRQMDGVAMATRRIMFAGGIMFGLAIREAAKFEQSMARVKALTGATAEEFARLSAEARRLGVNTIFSASQSAEAMSAFALAGFEVNKIMEAMEPTLNLAAAGQLQIGQAAEIVAKIMAGMKLEASELTGAVDVLTKAFTTAQTNLPMLGDAMKMVGPVAKLAGKDLEETVAIIQSLSNAGIQGTMAGTALRNILSKLAQNGKAVSKVFDSLGVSTKDAAGNIRSIADIVDDTNAALEEQGRTAETTGLIMSAFGLRAGPAFASLLSEGGDAIREFEANLQNSAGTAERIAKIQMDTLTGSVIKLKSALSGLAEAIGGAFKGELRGMTDQLTAMTKATADMNDATKESIVSWTQFAAVTGAMLIVMPKLIGMMAAMTLAGGAMMPLLTLFAATAGLLATSSARATAKGTSQGEEADLLLQSLIRTIAPGLINAGGARESLAGTVKRGEFSRAAIAAAEDAETPEEKQAAQGQIAKARNKIQNAMRAFREELSEQGGATTQQQRAHMRSLNAELDAFNKISERVGSTTRSTEDSIAAMDRELMQLNKSLRESQKTIGDLAAQRLDAQLSGEGEIIRLLRDNPALAALIGAGEGSVNEAVLLGLARADVELGPGQLTEEERRRSQIARESIASDSVRRTELQLQRFMAGSERVEGVDVRIGEDRRRVAEFMAGRERIEGVDVRTQRDQGDIANPAFRKFNAFDVFPLGKTIQGRGEFGLDEIERNRRENEFGSGLLEREEERAADPLAMQGRLDDINRQFDERVAALQDPTAGGQVSFAARAGQLQGAVSRFEAESLKLARQRTEAVKKMAEGNHDELVAAIENQDGGRFV